MDATEESVECPYCGASAPIDAAATIQTCPICAQEFILDPDAEIDPDEAALQAIEERIKNDAETLDVRRIRAVQLELRSMYRSRTWVLVLGWACLGLIGQLLWLAVAYWPQFHAKRIAVYAVLIAILSSLGGWLLGKGRRYRQLAEIEAAAIWAKQQATSEPDFSALSDGSQFAAGLSAMQRDIAD